MDFTHFYPWFIYVVKVFYMHFGVFLEYLHVHVPIGVKWWFWGNWSFYESIAENMKAESIIEENIDRRIIINVDWRWAIREV